MARITIDNIDLLDISIGNFGYWQIKMGILTLLINILIASVNIGNLFMIPPFELWCKSNENLQNVFFKESLPCLISDVDATISNTTVYLKSKINVCDQLGMHDTLLIEWNLSEQKKEFTRNIYILVTTGTAVGSILFGRFADMFGRKFLLIILILLHALCSIVSAVGNSYELFLAFKFISGMLSAGIIVVSLVLCIEVISVQCRTYLSAYCQFTFGIVNIIFAGIGCCMYKWREFQLFLAGINVLYLSYFWFLDESPRWMVVNNFKDGAMQTLERASRSRNIHRQIIDEMCLVYAEENAPLWAVFTHDALTLRTLYLCLIWLTLGTSSASLFLYVGNVFNNPYLYVLIDSIVLLLSGIILLLSGYCACGRQLQSTAGIWFAILCFCGIWVFPSGSYNTLKNFVFSELGVFGLYISMPATFIFTSELYPTVLRCTGVGFSISFFYFGVAIMFLVNWFSQLSWIMPIVIFLCLMIAHCYLQLFLPETKDAVLPNVLTDLKNEFIP
ncbi:hypothetical protein RN001_006550 [Aquatica leii]|uniref:Major facilitator superfamily (MFS) profile domain-containing protein n=1 Tax=Aquatica leii TaxID=1421715 RepID=A0AAN7SBH7_9COLE|nr:hypothetical protein RN001_006550 [Aquatica leii]